MPKHRFKIAKSMMVFAVLVLAGLLAYGAGIAQSADKDPALVRAAGKGDLQEVTRLLELGVDINAKNGDGETALMAAAGQGNLDVVKLLIDKGADVNGKARDGLTALMAAVRSGQVDVIKLLLGYGAEVNAKLNDGQTALWLAEQKGNSEIAKLLKAHGATQAEPKVPVIVAISKLLAAILILGIIARFPESRPDSSPFFARHKWTLWDAYKVAAALTAALVVDIVLLLVSPWPIPPLLAPLMFMLPAIAITGGYWFVVVRPHGIRHADFGLDKTHFFESGGIALNVALGHFALLAAGGGIPPFNRFISCDSSLFSFWSDAATLGLGLAYLEELLFRGVLYAPVAMRIGKWGAIVTLSLVECLMHGRVDMLQSCLLFLVFVVFFWVYIRTESLMAPVILHVGMNVPAWQLGCMPVVAPYVDMSTVELLYICAPLWALMIINTWRLVKFPSPHKAFFVRNNDAVSGKE